MRALLISAAITLALPLKALADEAVSHFTLDNGMEVVVVEDNRAPVVQHMVWYRAGSADEPRGASGVAHFLEHLMFKATTSLESGEFSATVAANGGRDNAFTSYDYTAYHQRVAADRLELMMQMEADRMRNIAFTEEDIRTERGVVLEERNQRTENNPSSLMYEQMNAVQYHHHPYGAPVIGWKHEIETLEMADFRAFYDAHYAPNNAILIVSGDVTPEEVRSLAEKYYGVIPAKADLAPRERVAEPPHRAARRLEFRDARVSRPFMARSYIAPERDSGAQEEAAALVMLSELLGGGQTSFLNETLQFDQQISTFARSYYRPTALDDTSFDIVAVPAEGVSLEELEAAIDTALLAFMQEGVDAEKLERIKKQLRAQQIYARDSAEGIGNRYGRALSVGLTVEDVQAWPKVLEAVTEADIMAAAERLFDARRSVTGYLMSEEVTQ
ncbi:MAG: pitrilysin family protein [Pseudomonadota bacterium]